MRGGNGVDKRIYFSSGLFPDLFSQWYVAVDRVVIVELINPPMTRLCADAFSRRNHLLDQTLIDSLVVTWNECDLRSESSHGPHFLFAERIGRNDVQSVTFRCAN